MLYRDHGVPWNQRYLHWLERTSIRAIEQRARICHELLDRKPRDLFLTVLGETHSALHDLWAASHSDHPLHSCWKGDHDPLLHFFRAVDRAVGELVERAGPESAFVLFSVHGMQHNATDLACLFFLSELLYRFNSPGRIGFAHGEVGTVPPPPVAPSTSAWSGPIVAAGAVHVHTTRSDGAGSIDDVARVAGQAGLQFIVLTDHGDATTLDPPAYRSGVLVIDGVEISTTRGHYGAVGLTPAPYPLAGEAREVAEDVRRLGGFGFVTHGDSPKTDLRWSDWEIGRAHV